MGKRFELRRLQDTVPGKGNPPSKLPNKRELVGYIPMHRRVAALIAAGLNTAASKDMQYYDMLGEDVGELSAPPLPRHLPSDLSDVSDLARIYKERRAEIEAKVNLARQKRLEAARAASEGKAAPSPASDSVKPV